MSARNRDLFYRIAEVLDSWPRSYDQAVWAEGHRSEVVDIAFDDGTVAEAVECGTAHCVAGWAAALTGWHPTLDENELWWIRVAREAGVAEVDGSPIDQVAAEALGLEAGEAAALFSAMAFHLAYDGRLPAYLVAPRLRAIGDGADVRFATTATTDEWATAMAVSS